MKKVIVSLSMLLFMLAACDKRKAQPINVIVPIDISGSRDSLTLNQYRDIAAEVVMGNLTQTSCFTAIPIDHGSETSCEELYSIDFGLISYTNEFAGLQADELAQEHHKDSLRSAALDFSHCFDSACLSRKALSRGTDITGALKVARRYKKQDARNIIVMLADMLHSVPEQGIDFEQDLQSEKDIEQFLAKMERVDLSGFEIVVLTGKQSDVNTVKYAIVQKYWQHYLTDCGARLISYSSGGVTQVAHIMQGDTTSKL